jgi:hypothetical protein
MPMPHYDLRSTRDAANLLGYPVRAAFLGDWRPFRAVKCSVSCRKPWSRQGYACPFGKGGLA